MCERITECSVEDLRATKSEQEIAAMELDKIVPLHTAQCTESCNSRELSPRQIQVVRDCLGQPTDCTAYIDCLAWTRRAAGDRARAASAPFGRCLRDAQPRSL
jgi:hypothetical protein